MWIEHPAIIPATTPTAYCTQSSSQTQRFSQSPISITSSTQILEGRLPNPLECSQFACAHLTKCFNWHRKVPPTRTLIGRRPDGTWATAGANKYQKCMSAAIAFAMIDAATRDWITTSEVTIDQFKEQLGSFSPILTSDSHNFGADYVDSLLSICNFSLKSISPPACNFAFTLKAASHEVHCLPFQ